MNTQRVRKWLSNRGTSVARSSRRRSATPSTAPRLEILEERRLLSTMWGLETPKLFSIDDYTKIGQGTTAAGLTIYERLRYDQNGAGSLRLLEPVISSFDLDATGNAFMAYDRDLKFTDGRPALTAPVLLSFNVNNASTTQPNVVTIVGSIPIPGFSASDGDRITGLSHDPTTGDLYAMYNTSGPEKLFKISPADGSVIADLGFLRNTALDLSVDKGEEIEFDEFGNLYVSDNADDDLYLVDKNTARIIATVDNNQRGGLTDDSVSVEGLGWDPMSDRMVAIEDFSDLFFIQTFQNGNNQPLGHLTPLESPEVIDFIIPREAVGAIDIEKFVKPAPVVPTQLCTSGVKPKVLTMQFTGEGPSATQHSQDPSKVSVTGDPAFAPDVMIVATSAKSSSKIYFSGTVHLGDTFQIDASQVGATRLDADTRVTIKSLGGTVLQTVKFHTSCSQPLALGDQFGSLELVGFVSEAGQSFTQPPPDTSFGDDADTPTGPTVATGGTVIFTYVVTNPGTVELANVRVTDDNTTPSNPADDFSPAFVSGDTDGDNRLDVTETWIYRAERTAFEGQQKNISVVVGTPVDSGGRRIGDDVTDQDPAHYVGAAVPVNVCATGKPRSLTMRYTGDGPSASHHMQAAGKVIVTGDPVFASPVQIVATNKAGSRVYFTGTVNLGGTFTIDASSAGQTRLEADTLVTIRGAGGSVLQTVQFHTSCSQPLFTQDQFGSIILVGFVTA